LTGQACFETAYDSRFTAGNTHSLSVHLANTKLYNHNACRGLLSDVASTAELPLDEDAATVRLLISSMYDAHNEVDWTTLQPLLELARKYDIKDIQLSCETFMNTVPLSTSNLLGYMDPAYNFGISSAIKRCQDFVATDDNFKDLVRYACSFLIAHTLTTPWPINFI
jgi:BTB/POZ domain